MRLLAYLPTDVARQALLTTFRHNGNAVATIVGVPVDAGRACFMTWIATG